LQDHPNPHMTELDISNNNMLSLSLAKCFRWWKCCPKKGLLTSLNLKCVGGKREDEIINERLKYYRQVIYPWLLMIQSITSLIDPETWETKAHSDMIKCCR
jgi:hypothetical protein